MKTHVWKMAWNMLSARERRFSIIVLLVSILGAGAQVAMIGSIMPFLSYVSDTSVAESSRMLRMIREVSGLDSDYSFAFLLGGLAITVIVVANLILLARSYAISRFTVMRVHSISTQLLKSYMDRPYEYFLGRNSGDIGKRILAETTEISNSFLRPAAELVASSLSALSILAFLTYIEPLGTLAGIGFILIIYLVINRVAGRLLARLGVERVDANKIRFQTISEVFGGIKDLKVNKKERAYLDRYEAASLVSLRAIWKSRTISEAPQFLIQAFFFSAVIMACLVLIEPASFDANGEAISGLIPVLGIFAFAGQRIVPEIQKIYAAGSKITFGAAALANVHEDFVRDNGTPISKSDIVVRGDVVLDGVGYTYPETAAGVQHITTRIDSGSRVGIVGGTGAGKTTLVDIILGLLEPQSGEIRIGDRSVADAESLEAWRDQVAYVPQTIFLADATISENIAFGVPVERIDHGKVEACARIAQIHDFILERTPHGYGTMTGERGVMLSGGQRQRIGIARALYRDASLIVMDEATSALDPKTEKEVMRAIDTLPREVTLVLIAHRLGTVRNCDKLLVLDNGCLVESGPWDELAAAGGTFAEMIADYEA